MSATPDLHPDLHHLDTFLVSAGRPPRAGRPVNPPVVLSSTYVADGPVNYARAGNPTWDAFEEALGGLEGGRALVHASGMGAISAALSLVPAAPSWRRTRPTTAPCSFSRRSSRPAHGPPQARDRHGRIRLGLDGADLVWIESPTNPLMDVMDVRTVLDAARARGVLSVVDNTLPTPLMPSADPRRRRRRPLRHEVHRGAQRRPPRRHGRGGRRRWRRDRRAPPAPPNVARRDRRAAGGLPRPARTAHARPSLRAGQRQRGRARDSPARAPGRRAGSLPRQRRDAFHRRPR